MNRAIWQTIKLFYASDLFTDNIALFKLNTIKQPSSLQRYVLQ